MGATDGVFAGTSDQITRYIRVPQQAPTIKSARIPEPSKYKQPSTTKPV
jgi:hypothetical protein